MASDVVGDRDLRGMVAVVEEGRRDEPGPALPWVALDLLRRLIPCNDVNVLELDPRARRTLVHQYTMEGERGVEGPDDEGLDDEGYWDLRSGFPPWTYPERTGDLVSVTQISDFCMRQDLLRIPLYVDYWGLRAVSHAIVVRLPVQPGWVRAVMLWRDDGSGFTERDRDVLSLLRPHLIELHHDNARRLQGIPRLTARERAVLQLAAQGLSNAEIASALFVSVSTVRKHMEHVFERTGTHNRLAAAAVALPQSGAGTWAGSSASPSLR